MPRYSEPVAWLSLIDVSGPFLAATVLEDAFPQGLEKVETPRRQLLRAAYGEWVDAVDERDPDLDKLHAAWIRLVLSEALEYDDSVLVSGARISGDVVYQSPEHGTEVRPDFVVCNGDGIPKFLMMAFPAGTNLENPIPDPKWQSAPSERMTLLCRASKCRAGLVTNGEQWMLVNAPLGDTSGYASWYARFWWQEPVTLKAFQSLLGVRRCFGPEDETLPKLLDRSLDFQEEVTTTLGEQVRRAVEVLIQSLGRVDQDRNGELLREVSPAELYEGGLTIMMRLVFVLCAEERGLLLLGDSVYDQNYAVSTLRAKLHEDADRHGIEVLEPRHDAWSRLLSVFRGIYGGIEHDALRLPALGGSLFDPDRFPFLEGRPRGSKWLDEPAVPLPIDNRTVLLLMTALQVLEQKGGAQLLSYRALDVEQIGHVYEGLLEFTAARVPEITLGLVGTKKSPNPQVTLSQLETLSAKGGTHLLEHLKEITGRSLPALRKALNDDIDPALFPKLMVACHSDEQLARRVLPFGALLRSDSWGNLLIYQKDSFAIVKGTDRRSSGTHYTPRALTEPIVRYTLEALVYSGPAEGKPQGEWKLKSSAEILSLKVCDMACGSGAFLVEACRYLSLRLVEAWAKEEDAGKAVGADGIARDPSHACEPLPKNLDDRLLTARRRVAQSCIHGVDVNHLAVELAKLSIWLVTLAKNKPFSFLDHALRCGDSLVGLHDLEQLRFYCLKPDAENPVLFKGPLNTAVDNAIDLRLRLEAMPADSLADIEAQEHLLVAAEDKVARLKCAADLLVAAEFWGECNSEKLEDVRQAAVKSAYYIDKGPTEEFKQVAAKERRGQKMFHWPLEFPEVIVKRGGFDAFVGNPPFMGGTVATTHLSEPYMRHIQSLFNDWHGKSDIVAAFLRRADTLTPPRSIIGILSTSALLRGETNDSGLRQLLVHGQRVIRFALGPRPWPGSATVEVVGLSLASQWVGPVVLNGQQVEAISNDLQPVCHSDEATPYELLSGYSSYLGAKISPNNPLLNAADDICLQDNISRCLSTVIGGEELYSLSSFDFAPRIVDPETLEMLDSKSAENVLGLLHANSISDLQHSAPAKQMFKDLREGKLAFACGETSFHDLFFRRVPTSRVVLKHKLVVFPNATWSDFTILQSAIFRAWAWRWGLRREFRLVFSSKRCAKTFPVPALTNAELIGEHGHKLHDLRERLMKSTGQGLTELFYRYSDPEEKGSEIVSWRKTQAETDRLVLLAFGWSDVDLCHDFYPARLGFHYTISEAARREIIARLLTLNHERHAEEVKKGLHKKNTGKKKARSPRKPSDSKQLALIDNSKTRAVARRDGDTWYFAYGSNMSKGRKQERTGLIRSARTAKLGNYRLAFNKNDGAGGVYANIVRTKGEEVWGVVYLCDLDAMTTLDRREGVMGGHYERRSVTVVLDSDEKIEAVTYVAGEEFIVEEGTPSSEYLAFIIEGAEEHRLPTDYIDAIRARTNFRLI